MVARIATVPHNEMWLCFYHDRFGELCWSDVVWIGFWVSELENCWKHQVKITLELVCTLVEITVLKQILFTLHLDPNTSNSEPIAFESWTENDTAQNFISSPFLDICDTLFNAGETILADMLLLQLTNFYWQNNPKKPKDPEPLNINLVGVCKDKVIRQS